jgi:hypothetical protein
MTRDFVPHTDDAFDEIGSLIGKRPEHKKCRVSAVFGQQVEERK